MPIYAYRCESCGFDEEVLQKMSDPVLTDCPQCGKPTFTKQVTAAGFQLKGSGWYVTDFREGGNNTKKPVDKPAADAKPAGEAAPASASEAPPKTGGSDAPAKAESATKTGSGDSKGGNAAPSSTGNSGSASSSAPPSTSKTTPSAS